MRALLPPVSKDQLISTFEPLFVILLMSLNRSFVLNMLVIFLMECFHLPLSQFSLSFIAACFPSYLYLRLNQQGC